MREVILEYARYNQQANRRLCRILATLGKDQLEKPFQIAHPSILAMMEHLFFSNDLYFVQLFAKLFPAEAERAAKAYLTVDEAEYQRLMVDFSLDFGRFQEARQELDAVIVAFAEGFGSDGELLQLIDFPDDEGNVSKIPLWKMLLILYNHQTHHRAQVAVLLDLLGVPNDISGAAWA